MNRIQRYAINSFTGLIPLLKKSLLKSHSKGTTQKAYLCSPAAVHVGSEFWDRGWGCGYVLVHMIERMLVKSTIVIAITLWQQPL